MTKTAKTVEATACYCSKFTAVVAEITDDNGNMIDIEEISTNCNATTRNEFAQGHDAKLKSFLIKAGIRDLEVAKVDGGMRISADAATMASQFGFGHMVRDGIAKGKAKAEAAQKRADAKHEKAAAKAQAKKAADKKDLSVTPMGTPVILIKNERPVEEPAPEAQVEVVTEARDVIAKVGRWTYKGTEDRGTFTYQAKLGGRKTTTTYTVVEVL